jgi:hypothetical protein
MTRMLSAFLLSLLMALPAPGPGGLLIPAALADDDNDDDGGGFVGSGNRYEVDDFRRLLRRPRIAPRPPPPIIVPGEIVTGELDDDDLARIVANGFTVLDSAPSELLGGIIARLRPPSSLTIEAARARILEIAPAAVVEPNHLYRPVEMPCRANNCPAFAMIGWSVPPESCRLDPQIGMIDTRINLDHDALSGQAIERLSLLSSGERPSGMVHGTAIAALLVGDADGRTPGLLPEGRLIAVEAFHRDRAGDAADVFKLARAVDLLAVREVQAVNLSLAGPGNALLERVVAAATESGMILIAAAGNDGPRAPPAYPAAYPGVIAVTAVDTRGRVFRQAGQGEHIAFAAPGVRLWTAASISGGRYRSGTSYAAPFVTAAVAVALSEGELEPAGVIERLASRSVDLGPAGRDSVFGWGLVRSTC